MHPDPATVPLRIALAGLGRRGLHHIEKLSLRDDCLVMLGADPGPERRDRVGGLVCLRVPRITAEVLKESQIRVLWIATPAAEHRELINLGLESGCDVVLEPPTELSPDEFMGLELLAAARRRSLVVLLPRRLDDDFVAALEAQESGELGWLESLERTVWQLGPRGPGLQAAPAAGSGGLPAAGPGVATFPGVPGGIWCRPTYGSRGQVPVPTGLQLLLDFRPRTTVWMNLCWSAPAVVDTGWRLRGCRGVYAAGVRSTATESGEMIEIPDPVTSGESPQLHGRVVDHLRGRSENPVAAEDVRRLLQVWNDVVACSRREEGRGLDPFANRTTED